MINCNSFVGEDIKYKSASAKQATSLSSLLRPFQAGCVSTFWPLCDQGLTFTLVDEYSFRESRTSQRLIKEYICKQDWRNPYFSVLFIPFTLFESWCNSLPTCTFTGHHLLFLSCHKIRRYPTLQHPSFYVAEVPEAWRSTHATDRRTQTSF